MGSARQVEEAEEENGSEPWGGQGRAGDRSRLEEVEVEQDSGSVDLRTFDRMQRRVRGRGQGGGEGGDGGEGSKEKTSCMVPGDTRMVARDTRRGEGGNVGAIDKRKRRLGQGRLGARDVRVRGLEVDKFRGPRQEEEDSATSSGSPLVGAQQQRSGGMGWDRRGEGAGGRPGERIVGGGGRSVGRESGGEDDSSWAGSERMMFTRPDGSLDLVR